MVNDETWNRFLKYDGQSAKVLDLSAIQNLGSVAFFCNINPPFCSWCFDYGHSKISCPIKEQICELCGQLHDKEACLHDIGCANCIRMGKTDTKHYYYYHKCPFRRQAAIKLEKNYFYGTTTAT